MAKKVEKKKKRRFILVDNNNKKMGHTYTGKTPRVAALKAGRRGFEDIRLRETRTKKVHVYTGSREKLKLGDDRPEWLPEEIWIAKVSKVGIEKIEKKK